MGREGRGWRKGTWREPPPGNESAAPGPAATPAPRLWARVRSGGPGARACSRPSKLDLNRIAPQKWHVAPATCSGPSGPGVVGGVEGLRLLGRLEVRVDSEALSLYRAPASSGAVFTGDPRRRLGRGSGSYSLRGRWVLLTQLGPARGRRAARKLPSAGLGEIEPRQGIRPARRLRGAPARNEPALGLRCRAPRALTSPEAREKRNSLPPGALR